MSRRRKSSFDIPPQALGSALQEFGRQADIQVLYRPEEVRNKRSSAIKGKLEPNQAITSCFVAPAHRWTSRAMR